MYGKDCYEVASERGITPAQAAQEMREEGWKFEGYNDCGEEVYIEPQTFRLSGECIGYQAYEDVIAAIKFANPKAKTEIDERGGLNITL